jgi:hypothetical protein
MTEVPRRTLRLGHVVVGAVLVLIGVLWIVEAAGDVDVAWTVILPSALIIVGAALVYGSRTGRHGGLITLGVFLTVAVLLASAIDVLVDIPLSGGVGDSMERPTGVAESEYHWAMGKMTVDLTDATFPAGPIELTVGMGELVVIIPVDVAVEIEADAGIGELAILDRRASGVNPDLTVSEAGATLHLVARVGLGKVEVRRG